MSVFDFGRSLVKNEFSSARFEPLTKDHFWKFLAAEIERDRAAAEARLYGRFDEGIGMRLPFYGLQIEPSEDKALLDLPRKMRVVKDESHWSGLLIIVWYKDIPKLEEALAAQGCYVEVYGLPPELRGQVPKDYNGPITFNDVLKQRAEKQR